MSSRPRYHRFSVSRFVQPTSMVEVQECIQDVLGAYDQRSDLGRGHMSLFKLSMLHGSAKRSYRPPHISEIERRVKDQPNPNWEPFYEASYRAVGAMAFAGSIMLKFKRFHLYGELNGALHAAKVRQEDLHTDFQFSPHVIVSRYNEESPAAMDRLYQDEEILDTTLRESPIQVGFSPVKVSGARTPRDPIRVLHTFQPRRIA